MKTPDDGWDPQEKEALRDLEYPLEEVRRRHRDDPPVDLLRAARAGVLPDEFQERVVRRLADDPWSRALIDGVSDEDAVFDKDDEARLFVRIQAATGEPTPRPFWRSFLQPAWALAAACVVLLASVFLWRGLAPRTEKAGSEAPVIATAPPAPPAFHLPLEAPPVRLTVAVLTWRGPDQKNHLLADLKPGLDAFRRGDYETAETELSRLAALYPESVDVRYYQGVSRLLTDDVSGAIESLSAARRTADSSFAPGVAWYLAVAFDRAGKVAETRRELTFVCEAGAAHAAEACSALEHIK